MRERESDGGRGTRRQEKTLYKTAFDYFLLHIRSLYLHLFFAVFTFHEYIMLLQLVDCDELMSGWMAKTWLQV